MYDDYDDYAADGYQNADDGWSPGEYFSPEGIKGRWAGEQPNGRAGGRGRPGSDSAAVGDPFESGHDPFDSYGGRGQSDPRGGYGADEYATGAYDLPDGADSPERGRRRRRDREDRGERTGILPRLRRDRGEDIWPDDGISDEDYWASVAADGPLNKVGSPPDGERGPAGGPRRPADPRPGDQRGELRGADQRGADQRGADQRGVTGRLGPPPGLAGDYKPGGAPGSGPMRSIGPAGGNRASGPMRSIGPAGGNRASGPMRSIGQPGAGQPGGNRSSGGQPAAGQHVNGSRANSGPMPLRPGTGPTPARPATGLTRANGGQLGNGQHVNGQHVNGQHVNGQHVNGQHVNGSRANSGPMPLRPGTGPIPARPATGPSPLRPATGPMPARPATGPTPTVGVTASRPPNGQHVMRPGPGTGPSPAWPGQAQRPGSGSGAFPQSPPRPSFQPNGRQPGNGSAGGRQPDRGDWGDRTERIERVNASGYPDQRPSGRGTGGPGPGGPSGGPGRGREDSGEWRTPDRREADRRESGRRESSADSGSWPVPARGGAAAWGGADDDPLTSQAYSRSALTDTDGRSYRVAARRSQAQAMLTEQTESFITGQYQSVNGQYQSGHTGDYPSAAFQPVGQQTGEYRQYQGDAPATAAYPTAGPRAYGSQDSRQAAGQPARAIGGPADPGAAGAGWPAQPGGQQYDRQPQQQRPQAQSRQPAPLPAAPLSAPVPAGNGPATGSSPAQAGGGVPAKGGLNPYDTAITGSYPYVSQAFPAALPGPAQTGSAPAGPAQAGVDDPYYRPLPSNGYPSRGDTGSGDPAQAGYGASYGNGYQDPRDRRY